MTADIVNLRRARKEKARAAKEKQAAENRVKFGRTKAEKEKAAANDELARRRHEALRREPAPGPGDTGTTADITPRTTSGRDESA